MELPAGVLELFVGVCVVVVVVGTHIALECIVLTIIKKQFQCEPLKTIRTLRNHCTK